MWRIAADAAALDLRARGPATWPAASGPRGGRARPRGRRRSRSAGSRSATSVPCAAVAVTRSSAPNLTTRQITASTRRSSERPVRLSGGGLRPGSGSRPPGPVVDQVARSRARSRQRVAVEARRVARCPSTVTSRPEPSSRARPSAHAIGVAGSPGRADHDDRRRGRAPGPASGPRFTGGTGQYEHGDAEPDVRRAEVRRLAGRLGLERGQRRGVELGPVEAGDREERRPLGRVPAVRVRGGRSRRRARASAPGRRRSASRAAPRASIVVAVAARRRAAPRARCRAGSGRAPARRRSRSAPGRCASRSASSAARGLAAVVERAVVVAARSRRGTRRATPRSPSPAGSRPRRRGIAGSIAPSSTRARTWSGYSSA